MNSNLESLKHSAQEILKTGVASANGPVKLACSFSLEDAVIIDLAKEAGIEIGVFAIDTGRLNEETYEVADAIADRFRLTIDWYFPQHDAVEQLIRESGLFSFRESLEKRHHCCQIRKVEPLGRALKGLAGWITGIRRDHGVTRIDLKPIETDVLNGGLVKINPLLDWSEEQVLEYAKLRRLPKNRLYNEGYRSIGCAPCTRAVEADEDARAGRWWWENPEHKECGLHRRGHR
jgi:phosphoadenosine phosphosulfate reductase